MTKIEKILVFLEKNNEITNLNAQIIKLFENLIIETDFEELNLKNEIKNIYIWFYNKYDFELEDYEYNSSSEKIVNIIKTNSDLNYNKKLQLVMELKDKNLEEQDLKRKILESQNSNTSNTNQNEINQNMINQVPNNNLNVNNINQNMINTNQYLNNGNQGVYNSNVVTPQIIEAEKKDLRGLKNLIIWETMIAIFSIIILVVITTASTKLVSTYSDLASMIGLIVIFGTIVNITSLILGITILVKQSKITRIQFSKGLVISVGILSILMIITAFTYYIITVANIIVLIITWVSLNNSLKNIKN